MNTTGIESIVDFITGKTVPDMGSEANRQAVERFLVTEKGFDRADIEVDAPVQISVGGEVYRSKVDLAVRLDGRRFMCIKCAAGSLGSREREILAASRVLEDRPVPFSGVSDGKNFTVLDTATGRKIGEGLEAVPSREQALELLNNLNPISFPPERLEKERIIFRSYDSMNVNRRMGWE